MFTINPNTNRIAPLEVKRFSDLGFTERAHLQEWLAHQPDALGEELLIIQKEFDGFDETRERLDLLALDKDGNLVVIENKLDDSGRDVVWQAIKYASYCASLTRSQVADIFQAYLDKQEKGQNARQLLCDFLESADFDELKLNSGNSQRLMFVAANFRKEVTSTALWLLGQGIDVRCFKVTPYCFSEQLLLNIEQIIPTPEAKDLMIGMSAKETEEKHTDATLRESHALRPQFWQQTLDAFRNSGCTLYNNISPSKDHWLSAGSGVSGSPYQLIFGKNLIRVQLNIARSSQIENKKIYSAIANKMAQIETQFGDSLIWLELPNRKCSLIQYEKAVDGYNKENWPEMINWLVEHMIKLEQAMKKPLADAARDLRQST